MKLKLIAPARKPEWGESFWDFKTFVKITGRKAPGILLALPTLAALTPRDVSVSIVDENVEPIDFNEKVDLVGITFLTSLAPRAYEIAKEFRARGVKVVLGGIHASMLPHEAIKHADSVVIGESEEIWSRVISDSKRGQLEQFYSANCLPSLEKSPIPRWDLIKTQEYCYFTVQTGRGCPYDCDFCAVKVFNGRRYRHKPIENVVKELKIIKEIDLRKQIFFADDNLLAVPSYAKDLMKAIKELDIKSWWCQASVNRLKDDKLLDSMFEAGCRVVFVGLESVSKKELLSMNKSKVNKVEEFQNTIHKVQSKGIAIFGSFIVNENNIETSKTLDFINKNKIVFCSVNILTPLPGTSLSNRLKSEKRILHEDWQNYNLENVCFFQKDNINIKKIRSDLLMRIYSLPELYKRFKSNWNLGVFKRDKEKAKLFTKGRMILSFKGLLLALSDFRLGWFVLKSLWSSGVTSTSAILLALNFHTYSKIKKHEDNL